MRGRAVLVAVLAMAAAASAVPAVEAGTSRRTVQTTSATAAVRDVMFVGNNWDGTATVVDAHTHRKIRTIDTIPDADARMREIVADPARLGFFLAIQQAIGEGHNQYTDDMFTTHDGRLVAVSRPSFADVVGIDLATNRIRWRFPMEGYRADHMGVSPDGRRLLVSDSTANKVHELDLATGRKLREFPQR